ncbi:hypothetical protein Adt_44546 [Abeliophyllum distichum]|uniref:Uncharacterized protein n=1 Tax=Abeliophyllum distichum TaxID=126358 RepID=A0ABD1PEU3_9LAMI
MKMSSAALAAEKAKAIRKAIIPTGNNMNTIGGGGSGGKIGGKTSSDVVRMARTTNHHPLKHLITIFTYQTLSYLIPYTPTTRKLCDQYVFNTRTYKTTVFGRTKY